MEIEIRVTQESLKLADGAEKEDAAEKVKNTPVILGVKKLQSPLTFIIFF